MGGSPSLSLIPIPAAQVVRPLRQQGGPGCAWAWMGCCLLIDSGTFSLSARGLSRTANPAACAVKGRSALLHELFVGAWNGGRAMGAYRRESSIRCKYPHARKLAACLRLSHAARPALSGLLQHRPPFARQLRKRSQPLFSTHITAASVHSCPRALLWIPARNRSQQRWERRGRGEQKASLAAAQSPRQAPV